MRFRDLLLLVGLGAIWGMSYVFIRVAAPVVGPTPLMEFRFAVGGIVTLAYLASRGSAREALRSWRTYWRSMVVVGVLSMAVPTSLIGFSELRITASLATVINATTPFFAALFAAAVLADRFTVRRGAGLALGFIGVVLAVGTDRLVPGSADGVYVGASLLAAALYGLGAVYLRWRALPVPAVSLNLGAQLSAAVVLVPLAAPVYRPGPVSSPVLASALGLALFSTALAYVVYYGLIERTGATQAASVTFVSPVFGILGGALLLGEPVGAGLLVGLLLIIVGLALLSQGLGVVAYVRALWRRPVPEGAPPAGPAIERPDGARVQEGVQRPP